MTTPDQMPYRYKVWFTATNADGRLVGDLTIGTARPMTFAQMQEWEAPRIAANHGLSNVVITRIETA